MTDKLLLQGRDLVTDNGDGHFQERTGSSLNGKRQLQCSETIEPDDNQLSTSKRAKMINIQNGLDYSASASPNHLQSKDTNKVHNGFGESVHVSNSGKPDANSIAMAENGSEPSNHVTTNMDNRLISMNTELRPSNGTGETPDVKSAKLEPLPLQELRNNSPRPNKDLSEDGKNGAGGEPEIITLSDSEDEFQEVLAQALSHDSSPRTRCQLLKLYQNQLRAEETKLILLRRMKLSLSNADKQSTITSDSGNKIVDGRNPAAASQRNAAGSGNAPPPLKRGQHQSQQQHALSNSHSSHHKSTHHHHPSTDKSKLSNHSGTTSSGGPPPLVNMGKSNTSSHTSSGSAGASSYSGYQATQSTQPKKAVAPQPPAPPKLTPEQTLAAAKLNLKKQLEQALQQVPAPKPPPPEVNFLPSLASGEFIYLIGMEEVVKQLLSTDQKDVKFVFNPFSCVQCDTDFTPVWKRDKPGSKNVICEKCITSNQKRVLKKEHTSKLKAVFNKAMQKEQDIERRVAAGSPLSDMPSLAASVLRHQQQQQQSSISSAAGTPSMPQLTQQHAQSSPSPNSQQLSAAQMHPQALLQAQAEQMRAMLAAQMALPYQLYAGVGVTGKQAADLHRQYLLDMINQNSRSSPWKS